MVEKRPHRKVLKKVLVRNVFTANASVGFAGSRAGSGREGSLGQYVQ